MTIWFYISKALSFEKGKLKGLKRCYYRKKRKNIMIISSFFE